MNGYLSKAITEMARIFPGSSNGNNYRRRNNSVFRETSSKLLEPQESSDRKSWQGKKTENKKNRKNKKTTRSESGEREMSDKFRSNKGVTDRDTFDRTSSELLEFGEGDDENEIVVDEDVEESSERLKSDRELSTDEEKEGKDLKHSLGIDSTAEESIKLKNKGNTGEISNKDIKEGKKSIDEFLRDFSERTNQRIKDSRHRKAVEQRTQKWRNQEFSDRRERPETGETVYNLDQWDFEDELKISEKLDDLNINQVASLFEEDKSVDEVWIDLRDNDKRAFNEKRSLRKMKEVIDGYDSSDTGMLGLTEALYNQATEASKELDENIDSANSLMLEEKRDEIEKRWTKLTQQVEHYEEQDLSDLSIEEIEEYKEIRSEQKELRHRLQKTQDSLEESRSENEDRLSDMRKLESDRRRIVEMTQEEIDSFLDSRMDLELLKHIETEVNELRGEESILDDINTQYFLAANDSTGKVGAVNLDYGEDIEGLYDALENKAARLGGPFSDATNQESEGLIDKLIEFTKDALEIYDELGEEGEFYDKVKEGVDLEEYESFISNRIDGELLEYDFEEGQLNVNDEINEYAEMVETYWDARHDINQQNYSTLSDPSQINRGSTA